MHNVLKRRIRSGYQLTSITFWIQKWKQGGIFVHFDFEVLKNLSLFYCYIIPALVFGQMSVKTKIEKNVQNQQEIGLSNT